MQTFHLHKSKASLNEATLPIETQQNTVHEQD